MPIKKIWKEITCKCCGGRGTIGQFVEVDDKPSSSSPMWDSLTEAQKRHCEFMCYDPDNPDVPLD